MANKAKHCFLHIGAEKTGSNSIQAFLDANRGVLASQGFLFPKCLGASNQVALAASAQGDSSYHRLMESVGVYTDADLSDFRDRTRTALAEEVANGGLPNLILSKEHCQSRVDSPEKVSRLAELLHSVAEQVTVIFYIRRQDLAATSLYSTALKVGQWRKRPVMPLGGDLPITFDYARTCRLYATMFGQDAMRIRIYASKQLTGGDVVTDFRDTLALSEAIGWHKPQKKNSSIGRLAGRFLRSFNETRHEKYGDQSEHYRRALVRALENGFGGEGVKPTREHAEAFYSRFRDGNEEIRRLYFPTKKNSLFWEDFSGYPEQDTDWMPTADKALEIGADLFVQQQLEIDRLTAELDLLRSAASKPVAMAPSKERRATHPLLRPFLSSV